MKVDKSIKFETEKEEKELINKTIDFLQNVLCQLEEGDQSEMYLGGECVLTYDQLSDMIDTLVTFTCDETYEII